MPTYPELRLNVYATSSPDRLAWALLAFTTNSHGVPDARLQRHGVIDLADHELVGIDAVVQALVVAVASPA